MTGLLVTVTHCLAIVTASALSLVSPFFEMKSSATMTRTVALSSRELFEGGGGGMWACNSSLRSGHTRSLTTAYRTLSQSGTRSAYKSALNRILGRLATAWLFSKEAWGMENLKVTG